LPSAIVNAGKSTVTKSSAWNVVGVDFDAKKLAEEAARRCGMPLGDWLNSIISEKASEVGVPPQGGEAEEDTQLEAITARLAKLRKAAIARRPGAARGAVEESAGDDDEQQPAAESVRRRTDRMETSYADVRRSRPNPSDADRIEASAGGREIEMKLDLVVRRLAAIENALAIIMEGLEDGGRFASPARERPWGSSPSIRKSWR
jgi:hypothetical protein